MKKVIIFVLTIILLITGIFIYKNFNKDSRYSKTVLINNKPLRVEVASDDASLEHGLSGRKSMEKDEGMLFVLRVKNTYPQFWMKGMNFPLDLIWIKDDKIVDITENTPPAADIPDLEIKRYSPKTAVDYVIEVNSGYVQSNTIKINDKVDLRLDK